MNIFFVIVAFTGGGLAAYIYTMVLWENVKSIASSKGYMLLMLGGFSLRMGLCASVFIIAGYSGHVERIAACLLGFLIVRYIRVKNIKNGSFAAEKINADKP